MTVRLLWFGEILLICFLNVTALKNKIIDVESACSEEVVNVTMRFENSFSGVINSKGTDCLNKKASGDKTVSFSLDPKICSMRIYKENGMLWYSGSLQVQMSETVQQATDPTILVKCSLGTSLLAIHTKNQRTGRMMGNAGKYASGRAWLEVRGSAISTFSPSNSLSVGEHTTLSVYTSLQDGVVGKPVDCKVKDGRGGSQSLTDDRGCTTDAGLVPALKMVEQGHWETAFPAFSFPDTQLVHFTCMLMICSGNCPQYDCSENVNNTRNSRDFQEDSILDFVELYNSVEVTAPNIELSYLRKDITEQPQALNGNEGWICLSGPRVALIFATLGALFLIAVLATLLLLIRHRRKYLQRHPYGLYS
ncbi:uncharacterized protein LOC106661324 [Cimex lectularius]|uniref:ZP domain-containing protein n=1 Tax=Cimex lectularius TaxID=79782 RepID=A0A8I6R6W5_CIMLE|nr:uncharacterized protein LOC106661324 [Cimex lectularius]